MYIILVIEVCTLYNNNIINNAIQSHIPACRLLILVWILTSVTVLNYARVSLPTEITTYSYSIVLRPDIVIYNPQSSSIALLELTCPLDSIHHIQSARSRKQNKTDYLQLLAEFDRLNIANYYETIEITVLGHYQFSSIQNLVNLFRFILPELNTSKSGIRSWRLDEAASASISASQRIFMVRQCKEWCPN